MKEKLDAFFASLNKGKKKYSAHTIEQYKKKLNDLFEFCGYKDEFDLADLDAFINDLKAKNHSNSIINLYISAIKTFYNFINKRYKTENLGKKIKNEKIRKTLKLEDTDILKFLHNIKDLEDPNRGIFYLYILFGFSTSFISKLTKEDVEILECKIGIKTDKKQFEYFSLNNSEFKEVIRACLVNLCENSQNYLFETKKGTCLSKPHFKYLFNKFKKYLPLDCDSIIRLKADNLMLIKENILDGSLVKLLSKKLKINRLISKNDMTAIYVAYNIPEKMPVILKILNKDKQSKVTIDQFKHEFLNLKKVSHPLVPKAYDFEYLKEIDSYCFTMEYFDFESLSKYEKKISNKDIAFILYYMLELLEHLKKTGISHNDINPNNILFKKDSDNKLHLKLLDFGLSKASKEFSVGGTFLYMPPEMIIEKQMSPSLDLYSLGITAYYLISGKFPFSVKSFDAYLEDIRKDNYISISKYNKNISLNFEKIISKMTAFDHEKRYSSAKEALEDIENLIKIEFLNDDILNDQISLSYANFIGRNKELSILKNNFSIVYSDILKTKEIKSFLISGEKGIGKKRLINEIEVLANLNCIELIKVDISNKDFLNEIVEICHKKRKLKKEDTNIESEDVNIIKSSLLKKLAVSFCDIFKNQKTLLIVENLECLDKTGLTFFKFYLDELVKIRLSLMLLFSQNIDISRENPNIYKLKESTSIHTGFEEICLTNFCMAKSLDFISSILNRAVSPDFVDFVFSSTNGNPHYIISLLSYLRDRAFLYTKNQVVMLKKHAIDIPPNILELTSSRLERLSQIQKIILFIFTEFNKELKVDMLFSVLLETKHSLPLVDLIVHLKQLVSVNFIKIVNKKDVLYKENINENSILNLSDQLISNQIQKHISKNNLKDISLALSNTMEDYLIKDSSYKKVAARNLHKTGQNQKAFDLYIEIADDYLKNNMIDLAEDYYEKATSAKEIFEGGESCIFNYAKIKFLLNKYEEALGIYNAFYDRLENKPVQAKVLKFIAQIKTKQGNYEEGIRIYEQAISLLSDEKPDMMSVEINLLKLTALMSLSRFQECKDIINRLNELKEIDIKLQAKLYNLAGLVSYYEGELEQAKSNLLLAIDLSERCNSINEQIGSISNLGLVYFAQKKYLKSINCHQKALEICENNFIVFIKAQQLINLGNCYLETGGLSKAIETYEEAYSIFSSLNFPKQSEVITFNVALVYSEIGSFDKSEFFINKSLDLSIKRNNKLMQAYNYTLLANLNAYKYDYIKASSYFKESIKIFKEINDKTGLGETYLNIADSKIRLDESSDLNYYIQEANSLAANNPNIRLFAILLKASDHLDSNSFSECKNLLDSIENTDIEDYSYFIKIRFYKIFASYYFKINNNEKLSVYSDKLRNTLSELLENIPATNKFNFKNHFKFIDAFQFLKNLEYNKNDDTSSFKLEMLYELTSELLFEKSLEKLLDSILDKAILISNAKRGFIFLKKDENENLQLANSDYIVVAARKINQEEIGKTSFKLSLSILEKMKKENKVLIIDNALETFDKSYSIQDAKLRSIAVFPVVEKESIIGAIYLDDPGKVDAFKDIDEKLISTLSKHISLAISHARFLNGLESQNKNILNVNKNLSARLNNFEQREVQLSKILDFQKNKEEEKYNYKNIITKSPKMLEIFQTLQKIRTTNINVLLLGATGVGKELIARAIHFKGDRKDKPFIAVNCGAFTESLIESELFGHIKGAFTGADNNKDGIFEVAKGGTVFLDEIGEMSLETQKKLLRVLQNRVIKKVGDTKFVDIDVRIVAATNVNLLKSVQKGTFRHDLYYRINSMEIVIPSLKDRIEDIPLLVEHFVNKFDPNKKIDPKLIEVFMNYDWPGNVRELENEVHKLVVFSEGDILKKSLLQNNSKFFINKQEIKIKTIAEMEKDLIIKALKETLNNKSKAAKTLGIDRRTLDQRIKKYHLTFHS
ncbi:MAG: sigma 54-interacting transcriptional regulator [Pseudomonadota bacterium]